jgi:hypothetical protein
MGIAEDTADDFLICETGFFDDLEKKPFLLARWLDTG